MHNGLIYIYHSQGGGGGPLNMQISDIKEKNVYICSCLHKGIVMCMLINAVISIYLYMYQCLVQKERVEIITYM